MPQGMLAVYWGEVSLPGSLSNLRSYINCKLADKAGKTVIHAFKAHLMATICTHLKVKSPSNAVVHEKTKEWLEGTAKAIIRDVVMLNDCKDPVYALHHSFLYTGFLYSDLRKL